MDIIVSARNEEVKKGAKLHAEEKARHLTTYCDTLTSCRIVLNIEKHQETAEVILHGKNIDMEAKVSEIVMHDAIEKAFEKIEHQLHKHLGKVHDHHKGK